MTATARVPGTFRKLALLSLLLTIGWMTVPGVYADANKLQWEDDDRSYDRARRAVAHGEILPIETILQRVKEQVAGEVLEIELDKEHGQWVYKFKILDPQGRLLEVSIDAQNGSLLKLEDD